MTNKNTTVAFAGGQTITLREREYLAQGGEGTVYVKDGTAYKIYHHPTQMIPIEKIRELAHLRLPNVIAPRDVLYHPTDGVPMGFTMDYVKNVEYVCRLIVGGFKKANNIGPRQLDTLVARMRDTLAAIHARGIVVADYNEMNILVDHAFRKPIHIDVDSYQTPSFPATAIMDGVRDRSVPMGVFNEMTDWFSWAVVTFQLYTGIHPFKGRHPKYKPGDLDRRMTDGISVFDANVSLPRNCSDFSMIPPLLLEWYRNVFVNNERSVPPTLDKISHTSQHSAVGMTHSGSAGDPTQKDLQAVYVSGAPGQTITWEKQGDRIIFRDGIGMEIGSLHALDAMVCNDHIYTLTDNYILENRFIKLGKIKHISRPLTSVPGVAAKLFHGVGVVDVFGQKLLVFPYRSGSCVQVKVPELEPYRIVDARRDRETCTVIVEEKGSFHRFILTFNPTFNTYGFTVETDIDLL